MTKKLSKEEQVKRIKKILANDNLITCTDCGFQYFPMSYESEVICPHCGGEIEEAYKNGQFIGDDYDLDQREE